MTAPTDLERFYSYVRAFELAYLTDDWTLLDPHFADGAHHVVHGGGLFGDGGPPGRANAIGGLRQSVHDVDRRFDVRIPEVLAGPETRPDGIWMRFGVTFRRAGLPELHVEGVHLTRFVDGKSESIVETMPPVVAGRVAAYLAEHGAALRPAGSPIALPVADAHRKDLEAATLRSLVRCYGGAKSEQDVGAALAVCDEGFVLDTVSFGIEARNRKEAEVQLGAFFRAFPDYRVRLDGFATGEGVATCWGTVRLTLAGEWLGRASTGRTAELPVFCVFDGANGLLGRERFFFDKADLCAQIGLPLAELEASLAPLRAVRS
jgi:hypothetical protein